MSDEIPWQDKYEDDKNFGTFLALEHLKTDYPLCIIAAIEKIGEDNQVKVFPSTDNQIINSIIAQKIIEHLQKYV